jgi:hypothetical protein
MPHRQTRRSGLTSANSTIHKPKLVQCAAVLRFVKSTALYGLPAAR